MSGENKFIELSLKQPCMNTVIINTCEAMTLFREGNRLYSYLQNRAKSLPSNYTIYYLTLCEQLESNMLIQGSLQRTH